MQLRRVMRQSGTTLKAAVNHFLRLGMASAEKTQKKPFVVEPRELGLPPGLTYDNIGELLDVLDGPLHR